MRAMWAVDHELQAVSKRMRRRWESGGRSASPCGRPGAPCRVAEHKSQIDAAEERVVIGATAVRLFLLVAVLSYSAGRS